MKKLVLLFSSLIFFILGYSQTQTIGSKSGTVISLGSFRMDSAGYMPYWTRNPKWAGTLTNLRAGSFGTYLNETNSIKEFLWFDGVDWHRIDRQIPKFKNDIVLNGDANTRLGVWVNGETIPVAGLDLDEGFRVISQKAIAPTYVFPSVSISASVTQGYYEIGTNLGTITFSNIFTQNNAGTATSTTYYQNGSPLGGNTSTISSLTTLQTFYANRTFNQGACINNNLGVLDCTGRINASSVNSGILNYIPFSKRYWGFAETLSSGTPSDAVIRAFSGTDNSGGLVGKSFDIAAPLVTSYLVFCFPASSGSVSSIVLNGIPSTAAFTITSRSFVNAQGYSQSYTMVVSNNPFTSSAGTISVTIN